MAILFLRGRFLFMSKKESIGKRVSRLGLLLALTLTLSFMEYNLLPPLPIEGVRLGLSNITVMYAVFYENVSDSFLLGALRSLFVFLTRGAVAGFLSFCGGVFSIFIMLLGKKAFGRGKIILISLCGGAFHSIGQLLGATMVLKSYRTVLYLSPIITVLGAIFGVCTAVILKIIIPKLKIIKS